MEGRFVNEGPLAEPFVGQQLRFDPNGSRPELHYWLREGKSGNAEVDFLTAVQGKVIPVEVKSGAAGSMRSLHQFMDLRGASTAVRFDLNPPRQTIQVRIPNSLRAEAGGIRPDLPASGPGRTDAKIDCAFGSILALNPRLFIARMSSIFKPCSPPTTTPPQRLRS